MKSIGHYIREDAIVELEGSEKRLAFDQLISKIKETGSLPDVNAFYDKILEREQQSSTGIGLGVAIPHARLDDLDEIFIAVGRSNSGIDFTTPDGMPVHLIFMIAVNSNHSEYLQIIARISWLVRNDEFRNQLYFCPTISDLYKLLKEQA